MICPPCQARLSGLPPPAPVLSGGSRIAVHSSPGHAHDSTHRAPRHHPCAYIMKRRTLSPPPKAVLVRARMCFPSPLRGGARGGGLCVCGRLSRDNPALPVPGISDGLATAPRCTAVKPCALRVPARHAAALGIATLPSMLVTMAVRRCREHAASRGSPAEPSFGVRPMSKSRLFVSALAVAGLGAVALGYAAPQFGKAWLPQCRSQLACASAVPPGLQRP